MIAGIRRIWESTLFGLGLNLVRETPSEEVLRLLQKLRPQDCGIELIRFGGDGDGGYLVPDDLEGIEYCFSPGVSFLSKFENELADRNIKSFLADYSVDAPTIIRPEFTFDKKFLGSWDRDKFITLASWKDQYLKGYSGDLILQMDIESAEWEVILSTPDDLLNQFRIMVIEFHLLERIFDRGIVGILSSCFEKLLRNFYIVHLHPNNFCGSFRRGNIVIPRVMEFTFLNKRRAKGVTPQTKFPHRLDRDNTKRRHMELPKCWYA